TFVLHQCPPRATLFPYTTLFRSDFFESEEVKASLATSAVAGTMAGPRTPGTAFVLGHHTLTEVGGLKGAWGWMRGGMGAISDARSEERRVGEERGGGGG